VPLMPGMRCSSGWPGVKLSKAFALVERHLRVAGQVQDSVGKHRAMAGGDDQAGAVEPARIARVEAHEIAHWLRLAACRDGQIRRPAQCEDVGDVGAGLIRGRIYAYRFSLSGDRLATQGLLRQTCG